VKLLHIDSSPLAGASASRELTRRTVERWQDAHLGTTVEYLDLVANAPAHLDADSLGFRLAPGAAELTEAQRRENAVSERLVSQFLAADVIVVGAPLYNFGIPSQLKAWIDRVAQAGRTFRYTADGPQGLAGGKTVIVVSTRGGKYAGIPAMEAMEHQESYLRAVLGFFGIKDVLIVRAEGLAMGEDARTNAMAQANAAIAAQTAEAANQPKAALRA
jgi:FMN-dependent NADH-azoreductase